MKTNDSEKKRYSSNPSCSADNPLHERKNANHDLAHLAHLKVYAPGGEDNLKEQMREANVRLHSTGKRWYVSYYVTNDIGKRERKRIYGQINYEKDLSKRMDLLTSLQLKVFHSIANGDEYTTPLLDQSVTIYKYATKMAADKSQYLKETSLLAVEKNMRKFKSWLLGVNLESKHPREITKVELLNYRNHLLHSGLSNRSVNNAFEEVRCLFNFIMKSSDNILYKNPCVNITHLPSRSESHVAYTDNEANKIGEYLRENNPWLLFYIKFVAYSFFRNAEARQIQLKHINVKDRTITLPAINSKVNRRVTKLIPEIFIDEFINRDFSQYPQDYYLFGLRDEPAAKPVNKQYFTARFFKVKTHFGLSELHTLYGFRHTFVSQLVKSGKPWHQIMALTGHTTMTSFQKYARSIMALPEKDLSDGFTVKL